MSEQRKAEVVALHNALTGMWPLLAAELKQMKERHIESLVMQESEELRGRIKQINDLLYLPASLLQEMRVMEDALPD